MTQKIRVAFKVGGLLLAGICASICVGCASSASPSNGSGGQPVAPSISSQPASQTVTAGQSATFSVAATGTAPLTYQWQKNGANISGANAASYTTPAATSEDNGSTFDVIVKNSASSVTSSAASLTVSATPLAPSISAQPANQTVTAGQTATFSVSATGTTPLSYQWQKNGANISGATVASYTTPAATGSESGSTFDVIVSNSTGSVTSSSATLTVNTPPSITTQPANQAVIGGQCATFSVAATGTAPLSYQWQRNGANISGATAASYTIPATTSADNGAAFDVVVNNAAGSVTSAGATLTVNPIGTEINFGAGFTSCGLTLNGSAAITGNAGLQLTDGGANEARSAFFDIPINAQSFTTTFTFQLTNANANGFTFTIQNNSPTALGTGAGGLGYSGIPNSVAVGFQLYSASSEANLVGLWTNGASPDTTPSIPPNPNLVTGMSGTDMSGASINLHSRDLFKVRISYDGTTLSMDIRDLTNTNLHFFTSFPINIQGTVGSDTAYVGFTGGDDTGGLTAIQDILSWSYSSSATGTSGTFILPVDPPAVVGAHDYSTTDFGGQYHTGLDLCPGAVGCHTGDLVYASADGTVQAVFVTSDPAQTMCDGSSTGSLPHDDNHSGNTVIIAHSNGKFSLYGNMDCVWPGIAAGVPVSQGARIGNIGNSQYGVRVNTWTPHLHFEIKDAGVVGDPATDTFATFTPDLPDGYGYHDPRLYLFPFSQSGILPTAVKVASSSLNVLTGPDTSYSSLNFVTSGQEFVAFASTGSWYQIYLPNSEGPISGWIPASAGSQILAAPDSNATKIQVTNTGGAGLLTRPSASAATNLVSWDNNSGFTPSPTPDCTSTAAKIWDGQSYVTIANQSGFDEFYLPLNYYFSSANTCVEPISPGPSVGWASSSFLSVIP